MRFLVSPIKGFISRHKWKYKNDFLSLKEKPQGRLAAAQKMEEKREPA